MCVSDLLVELILYDKTEMILPIVLNLALSVDKPVIVIPSHFENNWQIKDTNLSLDHYQPTTQDINLTPEQYIKNKTQDIIYQEIYKDLFQDEKEN